MTPPRATRSSLLAVVLVVLSACASPNDPAPAAPRASTSPVATPAGGPTSTTTPTETCSPARRSPAGPGDLVHGRRTRHYDLWLPADYDGTTPAPLLMAFHGHGGSKARFEQATELGARGAAAGYIVVMGDALGDPRSWNVTRGSGTDDTGFAHALADDLERRLCVDEDREFVTGHSNGSALASILACRAPHRFRGLAMVSAVVPSSCPEGVGPSVLAIVGDADPLVPFTGGTLGTRPTAVPPAAEAMADHRERWGCDDRPAIDEPDHGVRRERATGCREGIQVVFDTVLGGGHPWPGSAGGYAGGPGYDATGAVLDFFDQL